MDVMLVPTICLCTKIVSRDPLGLCCYQAACTEISESKGVLIDRDIWLALRQYVSGFDVLMDSNSMSAAATTYEGHTCGHTQ